MNMMNRETLFLTTRETTWGFVVSSLQQNHCMNHVDQSKIYRLYTPVRHEKKSVLSHDRKLVYGISQKKQNI